MPTKKITDENFETDVLKSSINKVPGSSGMIANRTGSKGKNTQCFNCNSTFHVVKDCSEPKDPVEMKKN